MIFFEFWDLFLTHVQTYWTELLGAFFMAVMIRQMRTTGSQNESLRLFGLAFLILIIRDLFFIGIPILSTIRPDFYFSQKNILLTDIIFSSLILSVFISAGFKNMRFYFSPLLMSVMMTVFFSIIALSFSVYNPTRTIEIYFSPIYITCGFFCSALSFYLNKSSRQNIALRSIGNGFIILTICYGYSLFNLIENMQQITLLSYTLAVVLTLASQIQFLNVRTSTLEEKLENEKKIKYDMFNISPFPIVISRLRDDTILYINQTAQKVLDIEKKEASFYTFLDYFKNPTDKNTLLETIMRQKEQSHTFEIEAKNPKTDNAFWISLTSKITDWDEEIVLFSTFKDITLQKSLETTLKEQASTDPLTGLYNRRQFETLAERGIRQAIEDNASYTLLMIDIDKFKNVNDTYGHDVGDIVLKKLAQTMKDTFRKTDILARYGGEEFIVFLSMTSPQKAFIAAEHIRKAVEKLKIKNEESLIPITVSIGVSDCQSTNLEFLIKQADEALYHSKENGRNQTTLYAEMVKKSYNSNSQQ